MLSKPEGCKPCPLYGDGQGFVPGTFPKGVDVLIVGQNPGVDEEKSGKPLIGATGRSLDRSFLPLAGIDVCAKDNVIRCRWQPPGSEVKTNELPASSITDRAIACCRQYDTDLSRFTLVVVMGAIALRKYGPGLNINEWAGFLLPEEKV